MSKSKRFFSQVVAYAFPETWDAPSINALEEYMQRNAFVPIGKTQDVSLGWVPPRGNEHDPLLELIDGQLIFKVKIQRKKVPSAQIKQMVEEKAKRIEAEFGRRPGKKEKKDLKDAAVFEALPNIFPTTKEVLCWLDRGNHRLVFEAGSVGATDDIVTMLVEMFNALNRAIRLRLISTNQSPQAAMAHWLVTRENPAGFTVDREVTLKSADESRSSVKYSKHPLDIDQVVEHVELGKVPTQLAMTFDERVSFTLTDSFVIKGIQCLDTVFEESGTNDSFDADITLITEELAQMLSALIDELGGLFEVGDSDMKGTPAAVEF